MLVHMLCWCLSTLVVGPPVSAAAGRAAGLPPGAAHLPGSGLPTVRAGSRRRAPEPPQGSGGSSPGGRSELPSSVPLGIHFCSLQWR